MTTPLLRTALEPVVERHRRLRLLAWLALAFAALAVVGWLFLGSKALLTASVIIAAWFVWRYTSNWQPDYGAIAREIEQRHPHLQHLLLTAVEQEPRDESGKLSYLQLRVVAEAVGACRGSQILEGVSNSRLAGAWFAFICAAILLIGAFSAKQPSPSNTAIINADEDRSEIEVTPGDVSLERGSGLVVLAKFPLADVPTQAALVLQKANKPPDQAAMVKNFEDPVFVGGVTEVTEDFTYRIEYAGRATRNFKVTVFEHPRLDRADAHLRFPEYTKLPDKDLPDTRRVSAVEGSKLKVEFQLNKPVRTASLVAKDGTRVPLTVEPDKPIARLTDFIIGKSATYEVQLEDAEGRASKVPAQFTIDAKKNRPPELKFLAPRGDVRVSQLEEVAFRVEAWDDFGLVKVGLQYTIGGSGEGKDIVIAGESKGDTKITAEHLLQLEGLNLPVDELVSWHAWAEDIGPDGQPRRTSSDMYFAEVRPFEEIFRQGDSAESENQQQQSRAGNQATRQAQTQKQIITASWNLLRAEAGLDKPSEKYLKDEPVILDSQEQLLEQTTELATQVEDPKSRAYAETAKEEMQNAVDLLVAAATNVAPLREAIRAEQAAYNALLKLASHEYNVTRRQRNQSSRGEQSSQGMQQQLDQLELKEDEKRYETQREAASPEEQAQQEQLAVLNRLKELAQRQNDINEKIKELQAALQEEKTEKEKEQLRRELKRLREEQQQMLADMDELQQKMEQPQNESRFTEERQKLEQARTEAQQAGEAMQRGEASQALASGARAQRELQDMRDELRRKTSKHFAEDMRNMRTAARDLAERQQELAEKLNESATKPERKTLDGSSETQKATQTLVQQKEKLQNLTQDMKRVSEEAEVSEPLLSTELYDTLRKSAQADTGRSLEMTQQLAERGYAQEARKFEEKARGEIEELKQGVERAAERVLGDEAEALRRARANLDQLTKELDREIANKTGQPAEEQTQGEQAGAQGQRGSRQGAPNSEQGEQQHRIAGQPGENGEGQQPREGQDNQTAQANSGNRRQGQGERNGQRQPGDPSEQNPGQNSTAQANNQRQPGSPNEPGQENTREQDGQQNQGQRGQQAQQREQGQRRQGQRGQPGEQNEGQTAQQAQPGQQNGEQQGAGQRPGQQDSQAQQGNPSGQGGQQGQRTAQRNGRGQPGEQQAEGSPDQQQNQPGQPGTPGGNGQNQSGERTADNEERNGRQNDRRLAELAMDPRQRGGIRTGRDDGGGTWGGGLDRPEQSGPLTGERYLEWSDRLRMVEEMLDEPSLRTEASRIREITKGMRAEFKRHSLEPKWDLVRSQIRQPLAELRNRVTEELARREKKDALVPIDRDPVPVKFTEQVRKYYENLGRSAQ